ncbi:unnamed protein product [Hermetia illucens]|uniref:Uncharacterized protein n=1 Tax=Hermetia illucens TaxID=343691 RepID=A0A7R8V482_HERIL|nr:uncharacterized protein LOC119657986 [Hermetia illucens]CAD7091752.1 unnamed protein product [Hermetia illucens]
MKLENIWANLLDFVSRVGPSLAATTTFLPCGLAMGYIFVALPNSDGVLQYGPLFVGLLFAFICAAGLFATKFIYDHVVFWHFDVLLVAAFFNLLGGCFFFIHEFDIIGAYLVFAAHGATYVCSLSYLHISSGKDTRTMYISSCFAWYILGIAAGVAVIPDAFIATAEQSKATSNLYLDFAFVFMACTIIVTIMLVFIRVLQEMGSVEYKTMVDDELRLLNQNGRIFEDRRSVIARVRDTKSFFYVTKNKQWLVSFVLLVCEGVYSSLFTYFALWFSLNPAVKLSDGSTFDLIMWCALLGGVIGTVLMSFFTLKIIFVASVCTQIILLIIGVILGATIGNLVPFWIIAFLFGVMFPCIKISIIETSAFRFSEILIFISYVILLVPIGVINVYFVADSSNLFFYSLDRSTLAAHAFAFLIIISMLSIIVGLQVPRLFKASLLEIQHRVLGIIFTEHNIEQLNLGYLQSGIIPTKIENIETADTASRL